LAEVAIGKAMAALSESLDENPEMAPDVMVDIIADPIRAFIDAGAICIDIFKSIAEGERPKYTLDISMDEELDVSEE
jgi:hypothetical protein